MIIDHIQNAYRYFSGNEIWGKAVEFLVTLSADSPEQDIPLIGDQMFGRVQSYQTRTEAEGVIESHERYIDIQTVIVGAEAIDWFPRESLTVRSSYNRETDVTLYENNGQAGQARIDVTPGLFVLLYQTDAHRPQMIVGQKAKYIKKAVVKIDHQLLSKTNRRLSECEPK